MEAVSGIVLRGERHDVIKDLGNPLVDIAVALLLVNRISQVYCSGFR